MKLSPLSVPYRVVRRGASVVFTLAFVVVSGSSMLGGAVGTLVGVALVGAAVVLLLGYEVAYWRRYEYELTEDTLDIGSGVVARRNREIPLRRIQNVDIRRSVVQRLLGIAAVDLETAGGGSTEAAIRYVSFAEARRLQNEIARLKRGATEEGAGAAAAEATGETEGEELFRLSPRELALAGALSIDFRAPGFLLFGLYAVGAAVPGVVERVESGSLPVLAAGILGLVCVVVLVSWGAGAAVTVLNYYGFRLTRVGDELQYGRGLLRRYDGSIPLDKVQTLTVTDNPLKRRFGYATLYIETAGYAPGRGGDDRGSQTAVPIADVDRVFALADEIESFGEPDHRRPPRRVRRRYAVRYLLALAALTGVVYAVEAVVGVGVAWYAPLVLLPAVPVVAHFKWRHRGHWLGPDHLVTRNGVLRRETRIVPYYRVQTVIDTRSLFQRRWRLGTVTADTAGSLSLTGGDAAVVDVDEARAEEVREELAARLHEALAERGRRRGWQWGANAALEPPDEETDERGEGDDRPDEGPPTDEPTDDAR